MNISDVQFAIAAGQLRQTAALLDGQMSRLRDSGQWQGPDADRFFQEWEADVRTRLLQAATKLDALTLVPFL
jgi:hypothetical protein